MPGTGHCMYLHQCLLDARTPSKASQAADDMQTFACAKHSASHLDLLDAGALGGLQDEDALDEVLARLGHRHGFGKPSHTAAQLRPTALELTKPARCSQLQAWLAQACSSIRSTVHPSASLGRLLKVAGDS